MEEETVILILLVLVMLIGSYMAGSIPLVVKLSEDKLKFVSVLGAGLLVGTALVVIIPEGIRSLYMDDVKIVQINTSPSTNVRHNNELQQIPDYSRTIGLSLVLGFVFMMLIDQISQRKSTANSENITATLGLVVHAAADGVALGAAATTSHQDVEIIIFLAIMLHKAPAAFGLVSFLLHEKIERQQIRKHLVIFSLSAPLLTLLTYFGIGQEQKEKLNFINATGIAMLFSAGTFLYVATVHVLPELTHGQQHIGHRHTTTPLAQYEYRALEETESSAELNSTRKQTLGNKNSHKGLRCSELVLMVCGALLPLVIQCGHHH